MNVAFAILASIFGIATLLPLVNHPHWVFRAIDFAKLQLFVVKITLLALSFLFLDQNASTLIVQSALGACIVYNAIVLYPYSSLYRRWHRSPSSATGNFIGLLSANVYQFNTKFDDFIGIVEGNNPDLILTMESNQAWDDALKVLEIKYPYVVKVPLENTYGMHFYSKLEIVESKVNYYVADDIPSLEVKLTDGSGKEFVFIGVHPPPPSPTEEENSLERDAELLKIAKRVTEIELPLVVAGDFNNVSWSKSTVLFKKLSRLIDAHKGKGFVSTFHADYRLLRFPIDQLFHSVSVVVGEFKALQHFGSDHFPLFTKFAMSVCDDEMVNTETEHLVDDEKNEISEMIKDGVAESGNRDTIATP